MDEREKANEVGAETYDGFPLCSMRETEEHSFAEVGARSKGCLQKKGEDVLLVRG